MATSTSSFWVRWPRKNQAKSYSPAQIRTPFGTRKKGVFRGSGIACMRESRHLNNIPATGRLPFSYSKEHILKGSCKNRKAKLKRCQLRQANCTMPPCMKITINFEELPSMKKRMNVWQCCGEPLKMNEL